jgi:hypothetical protein
MSRVIQVPEVLDHKGFEELVATLGGLPGDAGSRLLFNAKHVRWVSPYGLIGLLAAGQVSHDRTGLPPRIEAPDNREVRSYLDRMEFWAAAHEVFDIEPGSAPSHGTSDALLEITPIRSHHDVHTVVEKVQFSVMLSEVCQNIIEHADADGWVCAQTYNYRERLGREVLMLAVMDVGMGFEGSLGAEHARRYGESWSAAMALEAALLYGESRFRDPGRGQGLQAIRRQVEKWDGMLAIRSGDAQIALVPDWDDYPSMQRGLATFPGAQILIVMPARTEEER